MPHRDSFQRDQATISPCAHPRGRLKAKQFQYEALPPQIQILDLSENGNNFKLCLLFSPSIYKRVIRKGTVRNGTGIVFEAEGTSILKIFSCALTQLPHLEPKMKFQHPFKPLRFG